MPDLYEIKVVNPDSGEKINFGLSSVDTGNPDRLYKMFNIQTDALET